MSTIPIITQLNHFLMFIRNKNDLCNGRTKRTTKNVSQEYSAFELAAGSFFLKHLVYFVGVTLHKYATPGRTKRIPQALGKDTSMTLPSRYEKLHQQTMEMLFSSCTR